MKLEGMYRISHIRNGVVLQEQDVHNLVTVQGRNHILNTIFRTAESPLTSWYVGLIDNSPSPTISANDTGSSHAGWTEFTDYSGDRILFEPAAASGGSIESDTGTEATFTINATGEVYGVLLCNLEDNGANPTILFSVASFNSSIPVVNTDIIKITYRLETV